MLPGGHSYTHSKEGDRLHSKHHKKNEQNTTKILLTVTCFMCHLKNCKSLICVNLDFTFFIQVIYKNMKDCEKKDKGLMEG